MIGYSLREIVGQHHSMFCSADYVRSTEYRDFWLSLGKGEERSGRFGNVAASTATCTSAAAIFRSAGPRATSARSS
jgi:hypothetical protein